MHAARLGSALSPSFRCGHSEAVLGGAKRVQARSGMFGCCKARSCVFGLSKTLLNHGKRLKAADSEQTNTAQKCQTLKEAFKASVKLP
eukprot:12713974-Alexandrium_andersonii.AAC.1